MSVIVHISDTHFGTEILAVVAALNHAVTTLQPDAVILSGDITQRARKSQFRAARAFMDALPAPTKLVIPGNHDIPLYDIFSRSFSPYRHYKKAFGTRESVAQLADCTLVGLDATYPLRHTRGRVKDEAIARTLGNAEKKGVVIACAHQPLLTAWPEDADEVLIHAERTAKIFSEQCVDIVLSGHVHVPLLTTTHTAYPDLPRHFILAGAGTAISRRVRPGAPHSFNVIRIETEKARTIEITPYVFNGPTVRFVSGHSILYAESAIGWQRTLHPED